MGVGKGKGKGSKGGVRHNDQKKGKGKAPIEKRIDPSDGNGPFSHASFMRFHGDVKGEKLWKQAGKGAAGGPKQNNNKGENKKGSSKGGNQNKGNQQNIQQNNKGAGKKGKGKKGKGKQGGGEPQEKRLDPSDGNGPFTKASFIRFHGEEKGLELWEEAGLVADELLEE